MNFGSFLTFDAEQEFLQNRRPRGVSNFSIQSFGFAVATAFPATLIETPFWTFLSNVKKPRKESFTQHFEQASL